MNVHQDAVAYDGLRAPGPAPTPAPAPSDSLGLLLRRTEHLLSQRVADGIAPVLADLDLSPERWRVLAALAAEPGQTMTQLSRAAVLPPASLTRHMDRLVARGLVLRKAHTVDRRRVVAALTERGQDAFVRVRAREQEVEGELRGAFGADRFDTLLGELNLVPLLLSAV